MERFKLSSELDTEFVAISNVSQAEVKEAMEALRKGLLDHLDMLRNSARAAQRNMLNPDQDMETFDARRKATRQAILKAELLHSLTGWRMLVTPESNGNDWIPADDSVSLD